MASKRLFYIVPLGMGEIYKVIRYHSYDYVMLLAKKILIDVIKIRLFFIKEIILVGLLTK